MSVKKSIKTYYAIRAEKVSSVLSIPARKLLADDIHRLRVNIKKIRALASLNSGDVNSKSTKSLKVIKRLFARAGKLREVQLRAQAIQEKNIDGKLSTYLHFLNLRVHYEKKNFTKELKSIQEDIETPLEELGQQLKSIGKKEIKVFEKKGTKRKQELLKKEKVSVDELHELRKQLKRELYLHDALGDLISIDLGDKKTSQMLGEWHDCHVMVKDIHKDLISVKLPAPEIKLLKRLAKEKITRADSLQSLLINRKFNFTTAD